MEPSAGKSLWLSDNSLSLVPVELLEESYSTYYMKKTNMWARIRGFNYSTTADGPQIPEVISNFKVHLTKLVFDSFIHQQQPLKFQNPLMSISDQYISSLSYSNSNDPCFHPEVAGQMQLHIEIAIMLSLWLMLNDLSW